MYVQPPVSQYLLNEARIKPHTRKALEKVVKAYDIKAYEVVKQAVQQFKSKGVDENRLERLTVLNDTGVANGLLVMGQAKTYDAILVGRKGASSLREWVMSSVTANLVAHSKVNPIWMVDGEVHATRVLLAADGSRPSLAALYNMAFMLPGDSHQKIHVLHVGPRFQDYCIIEAENDTSKNAEQALQDGDRHCMKIFFTQALTVMEKNGIELSRLEMETLDGNLSVSRAIVEYARELKFGIIVLGRSGGSGNLLPGRDAALWIVPKLSASANAQKVSQLIRNQNWPVKVSIGTATFISLPGSVGEMIDAADQLMYAAK